MDLLYLSHCVPYPPDKGEKIRAFHELTALAGRHRVHLACFARSPEELETARKLIDRCASVFAAPLFPFAWHAARAAARFARGQCLNQAFYSRRELTSDLAALAAGRKIGRAVAYTVVMAPHVPPGIPFVLDMTDVDSEKWLQYASERKPALLFETEARRLRRLEVAQARRAALTIFTTSPEMELFRSFAGDAPAAVMENGVDFDYFDPASAPRDERLARRRYLLFAGTLNYYPNEQAAAEFARQIFPALRARDEKLEFLVVGRNPGPRTRALQSVAGVNVVGAVEDIRPYYRHAVATVAPLRIARGIQNKVLESLAMDKPVLASGAVCQTFGHDLPAGVKLCRTAADYAELPEARQIRKAARARFSWQRNLSVLRAAVEQTERT